MSLPLLHAGKSAPGLSAALDLRFALDKSLTAYRGPTPSFSRASTGTYFNASGVLTSAAINAPRFNHTFNGTSWVSRGLLVEEQRTNLFLQSNSFQTTWIENSGTLGISQNVTGPDGISNSAWTFTDSQTGSLQGRYQDVNLTSGATYTMSIFIKKTTGTQTVFPAIYSARGGAGIAGISINTTTGTTYQVSAAGLTTISTSSTVYDVGDYWRLNATFLCNSTGAWGFVIAPAATGTSGSLDAALTGSAVVYGAQVESGSFGTSYIATTTASSTRSADVCQITGSDFSGFWNGTEGTIVGDFDRLFIPTGTASALYTARDSSNNNAIYYYIDVSNDVSQVYASGASATFDFGSPVGAGISNKIATAYKANDFAASRNSSTPLTDTSGAVPSGQTLMEIGRAVSVNYLNGHIARLRYFNKRLPNATLQQLSDPDPTLNLQFALNKSLTPVAGPAPSFSRASTGTFFNASGVLTSASINTPRFDHVYSGGQWVSRGLLVEEQRTNLCSWSEQLNDASWSFKTNVTISANFGTAPDGNTTADLIYPTASGAVSEVGKSVGAVNIGPVYTNSYFLKSSGKTWARVLSIRGDYGAWFNLSNGTVGTTLSGSIATIQDIGNGWYRCTVARATDITTGYSFVMVCDSDNSSAVTASGTNGILVWGAQSELGAFPTSYIGTTSSSVTRSADVCQITGTSFGSMWNQGEGSFASEFDFLAAPADRVSPRVWYASDGAYTNGMWVQSGASDGFYVYQSGSSQAGLTATALGAGVSTKVSSAYKLNDFAASFNGASALTDTTGNVPTVNRMEIGFMSDISGRIINGHIAKLIYYPGRLTNTKLQQLST